MLRSSVFGMFHILDASTLVLLAGPLPRGAAFAFARRHGAKNIYQQPVDDRGRVTGDPIHLAVID